MKYNKIEIKLCKLSTSSILESSSVVNNTVGNQSQLSRSTNATGTCNESGSPYFDADL